MVECFTVYNTVSWSSTWVWRSFLIFLWILPQPSISILRLGHCTCPTWLGWQHRATSITGSLPVCLASKRQTNLIFWRHLSHIRTACLSALHAAWCVFLVPHVQWIMERSLRWSCCISEAFGLRVYWPRFATMDHNRTDAGRVPCRCCTTPWDRPNLEIWATTTWNSKLSYAISRLACDWYRHLTATQRIMTGARSLMSVSCHDSSRGQLAAFETYLMAHYDTGIFTDV